METSPLGPRHSVDYCQLLSKRGIRAMSEMDNQADNDSRAETLKKVISLFGELPSDDDRSLFIRTVSTFFNLPESKGVLRSAIEPPQRPSFTEDRSMSPKEFLLDKKPTTDIDRVACLAYYLTHYRDIVQFKTIDISKLNTEAAQRRFSNAAHAVENATKKEYLVTSTKGAKQLGVVGEVFVEALPDKKAAQQAIARIRPRQPRAKANRKKSSAVSIDPSNKGL